MRLTSCSINAAEEFKRTIRLLVDGPRVAAHRFNISNTKSSSTPKGSLRVEGADASLMRGP